MLNTKVAESIDYCFSQRIDKNSLKILHDLLDGMKVAESDINTVVFMVAAACAKHYKSGFMEAQQSSK